MTGRRIHTPCSSSWPPVRQSWPQCSRPPEIHTHTVTHSHKHWSISKMRDEKDSKAIKVGEMVLDGEMRRYSLCLCDLPWCLQCSVMWAFVQLIGRKSTRISFCPAVSSRHCIFAPDIYLLWGLLVSGTHSWWVEIHERNETKQSYELYL